MAICDVPGCTEHYACRMRDKGVRISTAATPSRHNRVPPRPTEPPSWNKQLVTEDRPGGFKMPVLRDDGSQMRIKEYTENRHRIEEARKRRAATTVKE